MICPNCSSTNPFIVYQVIGEKIWINPEDREDITDAKGDSTDMIDTMPIVCARCAAAVTGLKAGTPAPRPIAMAADHYWTTIAMYLDQYDRFGRSALPSDITTAWDNLEYVTNPGDSEVVCVCGNTAEASGFAPCDDDGHEVEPTAANWDGQNVVCLACSRVHSHATGEVLGRARPTPRTP